LHSGCRVTSEHCHTCCCSTCAPPLPFWVGACCCGLPATWMPCLAAALLGPPACTLPQDFGHTRCISLHRSAWVGYLIPGTCFRHCVLLPPPHRYTCCHGPACWSVCCSLPALDSHHPSLLPIYKFYHGILPYAMRHCLIYHMHHLTSPQFCLPAWVHHSPCLP